MEKKDITKIQKILLRWYANNGRRGLPWRETEELYEITVSEIMLQQTNVPKVIAKYKEFLQKFPTVDSLARARQSTVLRAWQGLGYNRRALNLHKMAKIIVRDYDGTFPESVDELLALPGIGLYTSKAILAFGCNQDVAAIDVNIDRVVRRVLGHKKWRKSDDIEMIVDSFLPHGKSRDWHSGLMDFASMICTKRSPNCAECPLRKVCLSYPDPHDFIIKKKKEVGRSENDKYIPRRIYRGRIVEFLRHDNGTVQEIGKVIKSDWDGRSDKEWLMEILLILEQESFISKDGNLWKLKK